MPSKTIAVLGTMDTKGEEHAFVAAEIARRGHKAWLVDVGIDAPQGVVPDVDRETVAAAADVDLGRLAADRDRGAAVKAMSDAAARYLSRLAAAGSIDGVIALGGGGGTAIATAAMRRLPLGFPKLMVSTLASGNTAQYVDVMDIVMMPSIVDVAGLNRISRDVFAQAAGAICGMVETANDAGATEKPLVAASMFGNTTDCVQRARQVLEQSGYEVLVFHATGTGGRTMEALIEAGKIAGVLDVTTTELADELVGGVLSAGPHRLEAAPRCGVPAVIAPGCLDMVNFHARDTVPKQFKGRTFYEHNPQVTLMRTTAAECAVLGKILAQKASASTAPTTVLIPKLAISVISAAGQPFYDPDADRALFEAIRENLDARIEYRELDAAINDAVFAEACAAALLQNMRRTAEATVD